MRHKLREGPGALSPTVSQYLRNRQTGVVVDDALGDSSQEIEGRDVPVAERLGGLGGVGLHEHGVAVGKVQDEEVYLLLHTVNDSPSLTEVALGVSGRMDQGHEHLPCPATVLSDVVLDYGVAAVEAVLVPQTLVDALGGVSLLPGPVEIVFEYAIDDPLCRVRSWVFWEVCVFGIQEVRSEQASCTRCRGVG